MENVLTEKSYFEKVVEKCCQNMKKHDYFGIGHQKTSAQLHDLKSSKIRNAFVIIRKPDKVQEWVVENYKVTQCPDTLHVFIKNLKILVGCVGEKENGDSYFCIKNMERTLPQEFMIFGTVEIEECAIAFCYNGLTKESQYLCAPAYSEKSTELFLILKALKELEAIK